MLQLTLFAIPLLIFVFILYVFRLGRRVKELEEKVYAGGISKEKDTDQKDSIFEDSDLGADVLSETKLSHSRDNWDASFFKWIKEDWLLKLGALLLLIGFGWLVSYAFLNNWIGPMGRITLGIIAGSIILLFGFLRARKYLQQGSVFMVLGSSVVILTLYAARVIYNFFTPTTALFVMFLSCVFIALASIKYKVHWLSYVSVILSAALPIFVNSPTNDYVGLFTYLLVIVAGSIWITLISNVRGILVASLLVVCVYSIPQFTLSFSQDRHILLLYEYLFAAVFFVFSILGMIRNAGKSTRSDVFVSAGNGLLLLAWIMTAAVPDWRSLIISSWMIVFLLGAFLVFRKTNRKEPFYALSSVGLAMLAGAMSEELNGPTLTIALAIEAAVVPILNYAITKDLKTTKKLCLLLLIPGFMSVGSIGAYEWATGILHGHFVVLFVMGVSLVFLGKLLREIINKEEDQGKDLYKAIIIIGSIYGYILVWLTLHAGNRNDDSGTTAALVFYTLAGLIKYFYGRFNNSRVFLVYGGITLGGVVARLILIDVWDMALLERIVTFFLIGTLLVGTAFVRREKISDH